MSYKVYAVNWSDNERMARTTKDPAEKRDVTTLGPGRPSAPTGLTAVPLVEREPDGTITPDVAEVSPAATTNQSASHILLYWYWPETDGGSAINNFRVEVSKTTAWPNSNADGSSVERCEHRAWNCGFCRHQRDDRGPRSPVQGGRRHFPTPNTLNAANDLPDLWQIADGTVCSRKTRLANEACLRVKTPRAWSIIP